VKERDGRRTPQRGFTAGAALAAVLVASVVVVAVAAVGCGGRSVHVYAPVADGAATKYTESVSVKPGGRADVKLKCTAPLPFAKDVVVTYKGGSVTVEYNCAATAAAPGGLEGPRPGGLEPPPAVGPAPTPAPAPAPSPGTGRAAPVPPAD
jgi:hypothetical protein